jgi:tetratricopeptide (TPR) repeat protein
MDFLPSATGEGGRYKLHDLAREFTKSHLSKRIRKTARLRYSKYYKDVLKTAGMHYMSGNEISLIGLNLFRLELGNIEKGFKWAIGAASSDNRRINVRTISYHDNALRLLGNYTESALPLLDRFYSPRDLVSWLDAELWAARELEDQNLESQLLFAQGRAYKCLGQIRNAVECFEMSLKISRRINQRSRECLILANLGAMYIIQGKYQEASKIQEMALAMSREVGNRQVEGNIMSHLGFDCAKNGDFMGAIKLHKMRLEISRNEGHWIGMEIALGAIGNAYKNLGEIEKAIDFQKQALDIAHKVGDLRGEGSTFSNLANAYNKLNDVEKAIGFAEQALKIAQSIGDVRGEANALGNLSNILYNKCGSNEKSLNYSKERLSIIQMIGDPYEEVKSLFALGDLYRKSNKIDEGLELYELAELISQRNGNLFGKCKALWSKSKVMSKRRDYEKAISYANSAINIQIVNNYYADRLKTVINRKIKEWEKELENIKELE